jgi:hypothetical protein
MILSQAQILELMTAPEKPTGAEEAVRQEQRVKLHGKARVHDERRKDRTASDALTRLLHQVRDILPRDKYRTVLSLVRQPMDTVTVTGEAYQQLERAFDGVDRSCRYVFTSSELEADWLKFRDMVLGGDDAYRSRGMDILRCRPNSVIICDLPPEQTTPRPEPYWYAKELSTLHSYRIGKDRVLEYVTWLEKVDGENFDRLYVLDDEAYTVYQYRTAGGPKLTEESRAEHELGYCPARLFWTDAIDPANPLVVNHPLTAFLGKLDWCQITHWLKRFGDLFNAFPITTTFRQACNYHTETQTCQDGYLVSAETGNYYLGDEDDLLPCPKCKDRHNIGPGTHYEVPVPSKAAGTENMLPAVGITKVDVDSLRYNAENLKAAEEQIFGGIVGSVFDAINNQAVNEKQVQSLFESRRKALLTLARNFEKLQTWLEKTLCKLRYGSAFSDLSINYGTEFFLFGPQEILLMYTEARNNQLDAVVLDNLQYLYYQTRFRRQTLELERVKITLALDPARHATPDQVMGMYQAGILSREDYAYKVNTSSLLDRFERENGPLTEYQADNEDYGRRIEAIRAIVYSYIPAQTINQGAPGDDETVPGPALQTQQ